MRIGNNLILAVLILSFSLFTGWSADRKPGLKDLAGPYMGEKVPGKTPEIFLPGIVSTKKGWEAAGSFSPDGKEYFFTKRATIKGMANRIFHMKIINEKWTDPEPAPFAKDVVEYESFISPDGKTIFFNSERARPIVPDARGEIWYVEKTGKGWGEAKYLSTKINKGWVMFVTASDNNNLYFTAGYDRKFGIYKSRFVDGEYQDPEYLLEEINYLRGAHPFIAKDESYLIFDSQPDGMGKSQLFISFKKKNGGWTKAKKFDKTINATYTENIPNVSPDGKYLFFHRNNDIYWVSAEVITDMKKKVITEVPGGPLRRSNINQTFNIMNL